MMKPVRTIFLIAGVLVLLVGVTFAQSVGDYQSAANGDWDAAATWQRWNGSVWATASTPPTGAETITIRAGDTVAINVTVTISDTLINQGALTQAPTDTNLIVAANGVFQHDQDAGDLPSARWQTGSTFYLTGTVGVAPNNRDQNFYNIVFNTPGMLSNLNMALDTVTIGGDIRVVNTGSARWYLTSALAGDTSIVTIMGDIFVEAGAFSSNGTGNANTVFEIHHYGNIVVTGGNFSVSRGSQGSGTGSTRWYIHNGDFSMSNATTQNSNATNAWFIFDKQGTQMLTLGSGNTLTALPIVVDSLATLDMGASLLRGSGKFEVHAGAGVATSDPGGLDSAVVVTGTVTLDTAAQFIFNGTTKQYTGTSVPTSVYSMVADNPDTVVLSQATTIYGPLILKAGIFDNTTPFDLGGVGYILFQGGNLLFGVPVSVEENGETIPQSFYVTQNYPNPFNPTTTIVYGMPTEGNVSVKVYNMLGQLVATPFDGRQPAGNHRLTFDAAGLPSGTYIYTVRANGSEITKQMVLLK